MATPNLIEVTLEKVHTHNGEELQPGSTISVTEPEGKFLLAQKVIKSLPQSAHQKSTGKGE